MIMNGYECTWPNIVPYNDNVTNQQNIFSVCRLSDDKTFVLLN